MNGGCRQSASSVRRDQLSLKVADLDALESGQPRAEENEADQKERRRIDVIVPTPRLCAASNVPAAIIPSHQKFLSKDCRNRFIGKPPA